MIQEAIKLLCGQRYTALHRLLTTACLTLLVPMVLLLWRDVAVIKSRMDYPQSAKLTRTNVVVIEQARQGGR